ncbi:hypothetical protein C7M84_008408 [Penaeus vannamei]|uniref:Uncharacterized protein n=1 Tax=Penaeus vannamei TaxID=6689 RepID=A0A3R7SSL0_PENVA|nr:hypothetical protein C7M84_008408 [Penaeus vannamei]
MRDRVPGATPSWSSVLPRSRSSSLPVRLSCVGALGQWFDRATDGVKPRPCRGPPRPVAMSDRRSSLLCRSSAVDPLPDFPEPGSPEAQDERPSILITFQNSASYYTSYMGSNGTRTAGGRRKSIEVLDSPLPQGPIVVMNDYPTPPPGPPVPRPPRPQPPAVPTRVAERQHPRAAQEERLVCTTSAVGVLQVQLPGGAPDSVACAGGPHRHPPPLPPAHADQHLRVGHPAPGLQGEAPPQLPVHAHAVGGRGRRRRGRAGQPGGAHALAAPVRLLLGHHGQRRASAAHVQPEVVGGGRRGVGAAPEAHVALLNVGGDEQDKRRSGQRSVYVAEIWPSLVCILTAVLISLVIYVIISYLYTWPHPHTRTPIAPAVPKYPQRPPGYPSNYPYPPQGPYDHYLHYPQHHPVDP